MMADFCKQCSIELFGEDYHDLAGLISKDQSEAGFVVAALCEGCGLTRVDHEGTCIGDCELKQEEHRSENEEV